MVTENEEPDQANSSPKNLITIIQNITDGMKIRRSAKNFAYFLRQNGVLFKYIAALFVYGLIIGLLVPPLQSLIDIFSSNYVNPRRYLYVTINSGINGYYCDHNWHSF